MRLVRGDVVQVAANLGPAMSHFRGDCAAIVLGSYGDLYGGPDHQNFSLMFLDTGGSCSWYHAEQLTFRRHDGEEGIRHVTAERVARETHERDVCWIAAHWPTLRLNLPGASADELMRRVGIAEPWGVHGEGMTYQANLLQTLAALDPVFSQRPSDPEAAIASIRLDPCR